MMQGQHRRGFIKAAGLGAAGAAFAGSAFAAGPDDIDLIVVNAKVFTVDESQPRAQAFAVKQGRFYAVGASDEIRGLAGKKTQIYDAKGMTIVPGFIDTHNHPRGGRILYDVVIQNPFEVEFTTIDVIIGKLRTRAAQTPPDYWVQGYFYDDVKVKDGRELNRHDLDKVSTTHPVIVTHRGGHTSYYNTKALEMAGVTKATTRFGGTFDKDSSGELNGRVTDKARDVFNGVGKMVTYTPAETETRERDAAAFMSKQFVKYGLTGVHHSSGDFFTLQQVRENGDLLHRVSYEATDQFLDAMIAQGLRTGFGDEWIRLGATSEHTVDDSFSERTMALSTPYPGVTPPYKGNVTETQATLDAWCLKVHRAGIQMNCHANGDVAIDMTLTAYERALKAFPVADARPKITHCSLINDDLIARMKAINAVPALFTTYAYYNGDKFHFYGQDMMNHMMAYRTMIDAGIHVAAGSDFGPGPCAPLMALQGMVTRRGWNNEVWGPAQRITMDEAIKVHTLNSAYNSHEEGIKGSITTGKLADFVVLADDPHTVDPDKVKDIQIVQTVTGGRVVYAA
ncbi:amidohydrolase [Phenylobacterium immobile]|uniref:amidohydrolase n=1 Tax=Phenylobacterium immobile TaxID=21 RepID=UPI000AD7E106|nr:amidohydrolase [Phenylobacterium immobile]